MRTIGLDIGGANVKAADGDGRGVSRPFAVWKEPQRLGDVLAEVLALFEPPHVLAVTMTAELADCFRTKSEGVDAVLQAVEHAVESSIADRPLTVVWQTGAEFVPPDVARDIPRLVAAANWHALATWAGRMIPAGVGLLVDVGTTTTDVIPLLDGVPVPRGLTDVERLQSGELVYSGVRRTPLCAVAHSVPFRDGYCPLAAELFATTLDAYLLLNDLPEDADDTETADGRPATIDAARQRIARAVCCDRTETTDEEIEGIARFVADVQRQRIAGALERVLARQDGPCRGVILSGSGTFLAQRVIAASPRLADSERFVLADCLDPRTAEAACAFAVARLAAERLG